MAVSVGTVRAIVVGGWFGSSGISKPTQPNVFHDGWFEGDADEDLVDWDEQEDDTLWLGAWRDDETEPRF